MTPNLQRIRSAVKAPKPRKKRARPQRQLCQHGVHLSFDGGCYACSAESDGQS